MAKLSPLAEKLDEVKDRIAKACAKAKREPSEVTLVAVTKTAAPEQIREILTLGVGDLGENRVQQLAQRAAQFNEFHARRVNSDDAVVAPKLNWHMIGHLQRNKIKQLLPFVSVIHSVDSLRLAEELDAAGAKVGKKIPVLLQLNASEEPQKYGVAVGAAIHLAESIAEMPNVTMAGLMTMAAFEAPEKTIRQTFARTREIFEEIKWNKIGGAGFRILSMGMSQDYEIAIEEGSTLVRVGSAIFGGKAWDHEEEEE